MTPSKLIHTLAALFAGLIVLGAPTLAHATPVLQVYMEGSSYNTDTESWELTSTDGTANVQVLVTLDEGETLSDVVLYVAFDSANTGASVSLIDEGGASVSSTTGTGTPSSLSSHGIYGSDSTYVAFDLGDFTVTTDVVCNMTDGDGCTSGDARTYALTFTGITGSVHLDASGVNDKGRIKFAPYSHDADVVTSVPELSASGVAPAAALLSGALVLISTRRREADLSA